MNVTSKTEPRMSNSQSLDSLDSIHTSDDGTTRTVYENSNTLVRSGGNSQVSDELRHRIVANFPDEADEILAFLEMEGNEHLCVYFLSLTEGREE
jgi:hypothetical protein